MRHRLSLTILFVLAVNAVAATIPVVSPPVLKNDTVELLNPEKRDWPHKTEYLEAIDYLSESRARYGKTKESLDTHQLKIRDEINEQIDARIIEIEKAIIEKNAAWKFFISHFEPGMRLVKITVDGGIYYHLTAGDKIMARFIERKPADPRVL